ncbi:MAG: hypothetical protein JNK73_13225 [Bacteroidia bacterium]|nr:hypothetical protein [Bacteroidia bacterium]
MYLASNVHITFPAFKGKKRSEERRGFMIKSVNSFRTESSWQTLTDTAEFIIAKLLFKEQSTRLFEYIKAGDPFYIEAGYNGIYRREFTGFISEVLDDLPVVFKCEDNMYELKRIPVNKSFNGVKLKALLQAIVPSKFKIDAMDVQLGDFVFKQYTVAQVLVELKDNYGIHSYFVDDTLVSGKIYTDNPANEVVKYKFGTNIIRNDLKYRNKDDYQIKVTMRSHLSNGKVIKVTVGDPEGTEQKLICTNVSDKAQLERLAQKELDRLKFDGYRGTLTGFGIPYVRHGYTANIVNKENPDKDGNYYVDSVTTTFDEHGAIRRVCKIGPRAAV